MQSTTVYKVKEVSNHRTLVYADLFRERRVSLLLRQVNILSPLPFPSLTQTHVHMRAVTFTHLLTHLCVCVFSQKEKVKNFKRQIIKYLEAQLKAQQQVSLCSDGV